MESYNRSRLLAPCFDLIQPYSFWCTGYTGISLFTSFFHIGSNNRFNRLTTSLLYIQLLTTLCHNVTLASVLYVSLPSVSSPSQWNSITHWLTLDQLAACKAKVMRATLLYPGDFTPSNPFLPLNFFFIPPFSLKVECSSTSCTKSHLLRTKASSSLNIHSLIQTLWSLRPTGYIFAASHSNIKIPFFFNIFSFIFYFIPYFNINGVFPNRFYLHSK